MLNSTRLFTLTPLLSPFRSVFIRTTNFNVTMCVAVYMKLTICLLSFGEGHFSSVQFSKPTTSGPTLLDNLYGLFINIVFQKKVIDLAQKKHKDFLLLLLFFFLVFLMIYILILFNSPDHSSLAWFLNVVIACSLFIIFNWSFNFSL